MSGMSPKKTAPAIGKTDADRCPAGYIQARKWVRNAQLPSLQAYLNFARA